MDQTSNSTFFHRDVALRSLDLYKILTYLLSNLSILMINPHRYRDVHTQTSNPRIGFGDCLSGYKWIVNFNRRK